MKNFLILLTLPVILSLQSMAMANDVNDYEIEGISVGDSLLEHYTKKELKEAIEIYNYPASKEFIYYFLPKKNYDIYKYIQVHVDPEDKNFIIESIEGHISYKKNISDCYKQMEKVEKELQKQLNINGINDEGKHPGDLSGNSKYKRVMFYFLNGDYVEVICYDMSEKEENKGYTDRFVVSLSTKKLLDFLTHRAYN